MNISARSTNSSDLTQKTRYMKKKRLITLLTVLLGGVACLYAQAIEEQERKVITVSPFLTGARSTLADNVLRGVTATLKYEKTGAMNEARLAPILFPSGNGFVVVGGYDNSYAPLSSAELWQDGKWKKLTTNAGGAPAFVVTLADGKVMVGGGESVGSNGNSKKTSIYDPSTQRFSNGPNMTVGRTACKGLLMRGNVYVAGNSNGKDVAFDRYDGSQFTAYGATQGRLLPYVMNDADGNLYVMAPNDTDGEAVPLRKTNSGADALPVMWYEPSTDNLYYYLIPWYAEHRPLELAFDARTSDYYSAALGGYFILTQTDAGEYQLSYFNLDEGSVGYDKQFAIPTRSADGNMIDWRGGVFVNDAKSEVYLVGSSGISSHKLHVISYCYDTGAWTIASAGGFKADPISASWTMLPDGRLVCVGGMNMTDYSAVNEGFIITPPTAGTDGSGTNPDPNQKVDRLFLVVVAKNGSETTFMLSEKPEATIEGKKLRVKSEKADVSFNLSDVQRFSFVTRSVVGIDDLQVDTDPTAVSYQQDGTLVISQLKAGATVGIYALDGKLVQQLKATHSGTYRLSLSSLPKGVYIVKANTITYKIMKR